jgi:hypothetical protein
MAEEKLTGLTPLRSYVLVLRLLPFVEPVGNVGQMCAQVRKVLAEGLQSKDSTVVTNKRECVKKKQPY